MIFFYTLINTLFATAGPTLPHTAVNVCVNSANVQNKGGNGRLSDAAGTLPLKRSNLPVAGWIWWVWVSGTTSCL